MLCNSILPEPGNCVYVEVRVTYRRFTMIGLSVNNRAVCGIQHHLSLRHQDNPSPRVDKTSDYIRPHILTDLSGLWRAVRAGTL